MIDSRGGSAASLARLGFTRPDAAGRLLADPTLADLPPQALAELLGALGQVADPDRALLALVRLAERSPGLLAEITSLTPLSPQRATFRRRLLAVLGASVALGEGLVHHPEHRHVLGRGADREAAWVRADLLNAVGADPAGATPTSSMGRAQGRDALRRAYRARLLAIAADDLTSADPLARIETVTGWLTDLADAALEAALALARAVVPGAAGCRLAVIAMGKCGARELNYVSDVDVLYVVAPAAGQASEEAVTAVGARLATELALACSASTAEGSLWPVDAALRPEGRDGPLVRTLDSYLTYYRRWAATWEFQALLKARPAAGDPGLGATFAAAAEDLVWHAADRADLVPAAQAMRRRVEEHVPATQADRQLKLGRGGLRDVEFSVQLLQLVHGRTDPALRTAGTLDALERLAAYGYVGRRDAAELDHDYRFLRVLEHRLQLHRLRRTHLLPTAPADLRVLARAAGVPGGDGEMLAAWSATRRRVRRHHEAVFYRPLLAAVAALSPQDVRMSPAAARERLAALGYRDPAGALRHIAALSAGVSRRAAIQRQLLPVLLGWFAEGADPDDGLLSFRRISERLGGSHWYLKMLRDEGAAAQRMAALVASSRLVAAALERDAEATRWLGSDSELAPRSGEVLAGQVARAMARQDDPGAAADLVRSLRSRELLRTAMADVLGLHPPAAGRAALSAATAATLQAALDLAGRTVRGGAAPRAAIAVIGMGRLGGAEMGYGSDADVVFVHDPLPGADAGEAGQEAHAIASELRRLVTAPGTLLPLEVDARLRPQGRAGALVPSLAACRDYYARTAQAWEAQAMLRAVPVAGDERLGAAFLALVEPLRHPADGADPATVREVRRIKARVEGERLPRGLDPRRHLKLGPGGLADVEWTVQLLQLRHAGREPSLRTASTTGALAAGVRLGLLAAADAAALRTAWEAAARARDALVLVTGRPTDVLPTETRVLEGAARLAGYPAGSSGAFLDDLRRCSRRARFVVERVFYG